MSYSGGMSEFAHDQQEQENESGLDLCECYHWHEKNRMLLDGFGKINFTAQSDNCKPIASRIDANQKPF